MRSPPSPSSLSRAFAFAFALAAAAFGCTKTDPAPIASPPTAASSPSPGATTPMTDLYAFSAVPLVGGDPISLSRYKGDVLLVVNVAAHCGYTPQYRPLGELDRRYGPKGFHVLGFVSDEFGHQAGSVDEIKACSLDNKASFEQFAQIHVKKGPEQHPLFAWLTSQPAFPGDVGWNFNKWLIGKKGELVARWPSGVEPDGDVIRAAVEKALGG